MTKTGVAVITVVAFITGIAVGMHGEISIAAGMLNSHVAGAAAAGVNTHLIVLRSLRNSDQIGAIEMLELLLDGDLMVLGSVKPEERPANAQRILQSAAEYRGKYPHKIENPEVDAAVKHALQVGS